MPRRPRADLAGYPLHLIQRGNNKSPCFREDADRATYMHWVGRYAAQHGIEVHAWVLMDNHVHLLLTPSTPVHASRFMQSLGRRYVRYFNDTYDRSGTLWEGRFRACPIHAEDYLFTCMRYIELNPVRAGMVSKPDDFTWSSYRRNALGEDNAIATEHALYTSMGRSPVQRQDAYRATFAVELDVGSLAEIRVATSAGHLLASQSTVRQVEAVRGLVLDAARMGRPQKSTDT